MLMKIFAISLDWPDRRNVIFCDSSWTEQNVETKCPETPISHRSHQWFRTRVKNGLHNKRSWEIWDHVVNSIFLDHLANILSTMNNLSFFPAERLSSRWIYYWQGGYRPCLTPRGWRVSLHLLNESTDHKSFGSDLSLYYSHHQGE